MNNYTTQLKNVNDRRSHKRSIDEEKQIDEKARAAEKSVVKFFSDKGIVCKSNVKITTDNIVKLDSGKKKTIKNESMELDVVFPNGVIEVKSGSITAQSHKRKKSQIWEQIKRYAEFFPKKTTIYLLVEEYQEDPDGKNLIGRYDNVKIITSCDQIQLPQNEPTYYIEDWTIIRQLAIRKDMFSDDIKKKIHLNKQSYEKAIVILTDIEIDNLKQYHQVDRRPNDAHREIKYEPRKNDRKSHDVGDLTNIIHNFPYMIEKEKSIVGARKPTRVVNGYTEKCNACETIVFVSKKGKCNECRVRSRNSSRTNSPNIGSSTDSLISID